MITTYHTSKDGKTEFGVKRSLIKSVEIVKVKGENQEVEKLSDPMATLVAEFPEISEAEYLKRKSDKEQLNIDWQKEQETLEL